MRRRRRGHQVVAAAGQPHAGRGAACEIEGRAARRRASRVMARIRHARFCHGLVSRAAQRASAVNFSGSKNMSASSIAVIRGCRAIPRCGSSPRRITCWCRRSAPVMPTSAPKRRSRRQFQHENIICRVPIFIAAAVIAKHTNAIATLPLSIATVLAEDLNLEIIKPPIKLPKIEIFQYWHNRFHREPGNKWIRSVFSNLFHTPGARSRS